MESSTSITPPSRVNQLSTDSLMVPHGWLLLPTIAARMLFGLAAVPHKLNFMLCFIVLKYKFLKFVQMSLAVCLIHLLLNKYLELQSHKQDV